MTDFIPQLSSSRPEAQLLTPSQISRVVRQLDEKSQTIRIRNGSEQTKKLQTIATIDFY